MGKAAILILAVSAMAAAESFEYKVLATTKTSTMEKELNEAAEAGWGFAAVMGGSTAGAGNEVVVVMSKLPGGATKRSYRLLATSKTSTMQKEIREMTNEGYDYKGQTVFSSAFGGREVAVIMERTGEAKAKVEFKLIATNRTSTQQKELNEAGREGFELVGMTVSQTSFGGNELVSILRRKAE